MTVIGPSEWIWAIHLAESSRSTFPDRQSSQTPLEVDKNLRYKISYNEYKVGYKVFAPASNLTIV